MSNFEIEKNVPIPDNKKCGPRPKYPYRDLEVGDSFEVDFKSESRAVSGAGYVTTWSSINRPKKFTARRDGTKVRFWRTE